MLKKKGKKILLSICLSMLVLSTYMIASAAETKVVEGERHSVYAFGTSIVFIVGDEIEAIPNNTSGLLDAMVDGQVTKGLESLQIGDAQGNKLILEKGSMILVCDSKEEADSMKKLVMESLSKGMTIQSLADLGIDMDNKEVLTYWVGEDGALVDASGNQVANNVLLNIEIISVDDEYENFTEKMEESMEAQREQEAREQEAMRNDDDDREQYVAPQTSTNTTPTTQEAATPTTYTTVATSPAPNQTSGVEATSPASSEE